MAGLGIHGIRMLHRPAGPGCSTNPKERIVSRPPVEQEIREPSLPLDIELVPLDKPSLGRITRFQLLVESHLDPDLVRDVQIVFDLPPNWQRPAALLEKSGPLEKSGLNRLELGLIVPDESRHEIRARVIVTLRNGRQISNTAVQWVDLGSPDPPAGMIGRIENRDGSGIRVYRGVAVEGGND
jgi:hypothetical protein